MNIQLLTSTGALEVKSKAPNGVTFNVKGKSTHEAHTGGQVRQLLTHELVLVADLLDPLD